MLSMWCGMKKKNTFEWLQGPFIMQVNDLGMQKIKGSYDGSPITLICILHFA